MDEEYLSNEEFEKELNDDSGLYSNDDLAHLCKIKIFGIGGGGNNAVNHMIEANLTGVEFYVANTDLQVLNRSLCKNRIIIGQSVTRGLGAGANPEIGTLAAQESEDEIRAALKGTDLVFLAAGMGGGTGTGAAPEFARIAKEEGCLTIGVVTRPFNFEGKKRIANATEGIEKMRKYVDSLIVVSNDKLLLMSSNVSIKSAFKEADEVLRQSIQSITDLISVPSVINLDFADIRTVMEGKGTAMIGFGKGSGPKKAHEAATQAISSVLLESSFVGAKNAIVNITCNESATLDDTTEIFEIIKEAAGTDINIIWGYTTNDKLDDEILVSVIATDFDDSITPTPRGLGEVVKPIEVQERLDIDLEEPEDTSKDGNSLIPPFMQQNRMGE